MRKWRRNASNNGILIKRGGRNASKRSRSRSLGRRMNQIRRNMRPKNQKPQFLTSKDLWCIFGIYGARLGFMVHVWDLWCTFGMYGARFGFMAQLWRKVLRFWRKLWRTSCRKCVRCMARRLVALWVRCLRSTILVSVVSSFLCFFVVVRTCVSVVSAFRLRCAFIVQFLAL